MPASFDDQFFAAVVDAAPDAMLIVDRDGTVVFTNRQASAVFGYGADELIGAKVDELLPSSLRAAHRADRTRYVADPQVRPMGLDLALRAQRRDGSEFPVEISLSPVRSGDDVLVVAAVRDITVRVAAQTELRRVLRTLDATDDGVFIFDAATLQFSYVNSGAARQVGYDRDALIGMTPMQLNPVLGEAQLRELFQPLLDGTSESVNLHTTHRRKDGTDVPVELSVQLAPSPSGDDASLIAVGRDIAARLEAEEQLRQSQLALLEAEQVLAVADDRERIARDLHDTVIQRLFAAGLTLQATATRTEGEVRDRLQTVVDDLDATIRDVRTAVFSLQATRPSERGLRGALLDVTDDARRSLGFEPRLQFDGPVESIDDQVAEHLVPVLREALSNVAKHAKATEVRVAVRVGDTVELTIADNGVGMPDAVFGGNGLSNLRARAEAVGGELTIDRLDESGCIVRWTVPIAVLPEPSTT